MLGRWVAEQVLEKGIMIYDGVCPTHGVLSVASVKRVFPTANFSLQTAVSAAAYTVPI